MEVARGNAPETLAWDSASTRFRTDQDALEFEDFEISNYLDHLQPGQNMLAIQGLNSGATSNDFIIMPQLVGKTVVDAGISPTATRFTGPITLSEDTLVKARAFVQGDWTALTETRFTVGDGQ